MSTDSTRSSPGAGRPAFAVAGRVDKFRAVQASLALQAEHQQQVVHCRQHGIGLAAYRAWSHRQAKAALKTSPPIPLDRINVGQPRRHVG